VLNGPRELLAALRGLGVDALNLANNHQNDQLPAGIAETAAAVRAAGLGAFGAGDDRAAAEQPLYLEREGVKVALLGWTFALNRELRGAGQNQPWIAQWDKHRAFRAVEAARSEADLVIASTHWGAELKPEIFSHQRHAAELLCGAGADLVIGSGPHILQPVEWVEHTRTGRRCLVAFSLGNLVSNQGLKYRYRWKPPDLTQAQNVPDTRDGLLLRVTFRGGDGQPVVETIEGVPLWTENNFLARHVAATEVVDRIWVEPILPRLDRLEPAADERRLLEQRLARIRERVGELVELAPN
jgi:poly-gamma-glutamate synthesis protein (capsule biosynthesis protein)